MDLRNSHTEKIHVPLLMMSKLFTQSSGSGPDLVLIHGWGLHGGVWDGFVPLLEPYFRILRVDLPGHGSSGWSGEATLDDMTAAVLAVTPAKAAWLGWSLGGLVAMRAALQAPARVRALLLLASTPCFVRRHGWQCALLPALLDTFAAELQQDYLRTLNRFLALQVRGSDSSGPVLRLLRDQLLAKGEPAPAALQAGLDILRNTDLREDLPARCWLWPANATHWFRPRLPGQQPTSCRMRVSRPSPVPGMPLSLPGLRAWPVWCMHSCSHSRGT
jgi:pimeloyl-[acyl-carrier protein] methyl ester esterase